MYKNFECTCLCKFNKHKVVIYRNIEIFGSIDGESPFRKCRVKDTKLITKFTSYLKNNFYQPISIARSILFAIAVEVFLISNILLEFILKSYKISCIVRIDFFANAATWEAFKNDSLFKSPTVSRLMALMLKRTTNLVS